MLCNQSCKSVCVPLHTGMMLKENNTLKELDLWGCGLQPEGLEEVIKGVQVNTKLETLHLFYNTIDAKSASCLGMNTGTMTFHIYSYLYTSLSCQVVTPLSHDVKTVSLHGPSHLPPPHIPSITTALHVPNTHRCTFLYVCTCWPKYGDPEA